MKSQNVKATRLQASVFILVFLLAISLTLGAFQYLSANSYRESLAESKTAFDTLISELNETQNQVDTYALQLQYYRQLADYHAQQAQSYLEKLLEAKVEGKNPPSEILTAQMQAPSVRIEDVVYGRFVGVPITLIVQIRPGEGSIFVNTEPKMGLDIQGSVKMAARVAENLTGFRLADRDIAISVKAPEAMEAVDGPSAGASLTILMVSALEGLKTRSDVMLTGTIEPDGRIGPVGGIFEKAEAAAKIGATIFIIPEGQAEQTIYQRVVRKVFGFDIITIESVTIDIRDYAAEKWNMRVVEARYIAEALRYATIEP